MTNIYLFYLFVAKEAILINRLENIVYRPNIARLIFPTYKAAYNK